MNGCIENFHGWFDEKFWAKETFTNLEDMRAKPTHFVVQYNDLSAWKKRNKSLVINHQITRIYTDFFSFLLGWVGYF